ncbi:MAG TPA: bifunctional DNA-formamidopyrimidine glycosylase/DNA-(apurinic or apyrimidinic site) lyase [Tepidisphaeraceae bacterium]|jgi:formamidopyrimidine-DNA glycosylase|nr:bifunctional DNA-formamidopyrimidine glycosylase/DNA-(apurinic or apyrimidinic site) lyase [Tepidisphaeraceae bacterium]
MPELPEVETVVRTLRPRIIGRKIQRVTLHRDDIVQPRDIDLRKLLTNRAITDLSRRGKRIVFTLNNNQRFYIHLGMSGRLTIETDEKPLEKHTHLVIDLTPKDSASQLRFKDPRRFGGIFWLGADDSGGTMGPEPLEVRLNVLIEKLARTKRAIKNVLLDQTVLAGIGNIYADEALFEAGIHPLARADKLNSEQARRLHAAIKKILRRAIKHRGSTLRDYVDAEGGKGAFQNLHRVYDRADLPCRTCKTPISRIVLGGRSTHFCPTCQPKKAKRK